MTIPSSLPSSTRKPGVYHEFDFSKSGPALTPLERRVVIVAEKSSAGTATADTPVQLFGEADGDTKCGVGSLAALMNRAAILQAKLSGVGQPEIWAVPLTEPGGGSVAAQYTFTVTGPATASKDLIMEVAGRMITVGVSSGHSANTIASAIGSKFDELGPTLPFTSAVVDNVVTITFRTKGVNGNDVARRNVQLPAGVGVAHAASVAGTGATTIATGLAACYDRRYHGFAFANHVTGDATAILADIATAWGFGVKNFRWAHFGERGSLGTATTLAAAYNDQRAHVLNIEGSGTLPGELAVMDAVAWWAREAPNANLDAEIIGAAPPVPADVFADSEIESALASGVTPGVPAGNGYCKIVRRVTTQITLSSVPFEPTREPALARTAAFLAEQIDIGLQVALHQRTMWVDPEGANDIYTDARDIIVDKHRAAERAGYISDVDSFLPEIRVEKHPDVAGRLVAQDPFAVAGPHHQTACTHVAYLR
jgi:phage tail sheath gpL-like